MDTSICSPHVVPRREKEEEEKTLKGCTASASRKHRSPALRNPQKWAIGRDGLSHCEINCVLHGLKEHLGYHHSSRGFNHLGRMCPCRCFIDLPAVTCNYCNYLAAPEHTCHILTLATALDLTFRSQPVFLSEERAWLAPERPLLSGGRWLRYGAWTAPPLLRLVPGQFRVSASEEIVRNTPNHTQTLLELKRP